MGTLTVLAFFFLAQELYGQRLALLTTVLVAADRWHITFSRIVYELMPLALALQTLFPGQGPEDRPAALVGGWRG